MHGELAKCCTDQIGGGATLRAACMAKDGGGAPPLRCGRTLKLPRCMYDYTCRRTSCPICQRTHDSAAVCPVVCTTDARLHQTPCVPWYILRLSADLLVPIPRLLYHKPWLCHGVFRVYVVYATAIRLHPPLCIPWHIPRIFALYNVPIPPSTYILDPIYYMKEFINTITKEGMGKYVCRKKVQKWFDQGIKFVSEETRELRTRGTTRQA